MGKRLWRGASALVNKTRAFLMEELGSMEIGEEVSHALSHSKLEEGSNEGVSDLCWKPEVVGKFGLVKGMWVWK